MVMSGQPTVREQEDMTRRGDIKAEQSAGMQVPDDGLSVGYLISRARSAVLTNLDVELEPLGMTSVQYGVLKYIAAGTAETAADLCRLMHYDNGSMTRLLDRLEDKCLLRRERSKDDRRLVFLRLTNTARVLLPRLRAVAVRVLDRHLSGFSTTEIDSLKQYLSRMIENGQSDRNGPSDKS
jgi:DNA-binding MarR family transcriptional regulator